jgi:hypothetical protein
VSMAHPLTRMARWAPQQRELLVLCGGVKSGHEGEERATRDFKDEPSGRPRPRAALAAGNRRSGRPQGGSNHAGGARNQIRATDSWMADSTSNRVGAVGRGEAQANVEEGRPSRGNAGSPGV